MNEASFYTHIPIFYAAVGRFINPALSAAFTGSPILR
jgi:hypothetical protein